MTFLRPDLSYLDDDEAMRKVRADRAKIEPLLARATTVDLFGPLTHNLPTIKHAGSSLVPEWALHSSRPQVVRLLSDSRGGYADIQAQECETVVMFAGAADADDPGCPPLIAIQLSGYTERLVINLPLVEKDGIHSWYSPEGQVTVRPHRGSYIHVREVVIIFHTVGSNEADATTQLLANLSVSDSHPGGAAGGVDQQHHSNSDDEDFEDEDEDGYPTEYGYINWGTPADYPPDVDDYDCGNDLGWLSLTETFEEILTRSHPKVLLVGPPERMRKGDGIVNLADNLAMHLRDAMGFGAPPRVLRRSHAEYKQEVGEARYRLVAHAPAIDSYRWPESSIPAITDNNRYVPYANPLFGRFAMG